MVCWLLFFENSQTIIVYLFILGDYKYWRENTVQNSTSMYIPQSADIELTSYVLLARLENFDKSQGASLVPIVKWINSQRNSLGGFYSTQVNRFIFPKILKNSLIFVVKKDTVVALDALSKFASLYHAKRISLKVLYSLNQASTSKSLSVAQNNRLLLQKVKLQPIFENKTNTFTVNVTGSGSGLVQLTVKYNTKREQKLKRDFDLIIQYLKNADCKVATVEVKTK